jgi:predicted MFS family arabinose efflux permease
VPVAERSRLQSLVYSDIALSGATFAAALLLMCHACRWVPVAERSRSLSLVYSGMFIGSICGLALSPAMIEAMGWPSVFYIFGSMGVIWYSVWSSKAASTPSDDPMISNAEKVGGNDFKRIWVGAGMQHLGQHGSKHTFR